MDFGLFPDARGTERNGQKRENQAQNRPGSGEGEVRKFPHEATRTRGSTRERTRKIPNSDELGIVYWWSWRDLNPRPQAFSEQFYMCSRLIDVSPSVLRSGTPHKKPAPLNLAQRQGARRHASQYEFPRSQDSFSATLTQPIGQLLRGSPD